MQENPRKVALMILAKRKAAGGEVGGDDGKDGDGLESAAEELIAALHAKDAAGVVDALRSAFAQMESEPHEENEQ